MFGDRYQTNPRFELRTEDWQMLRLWRTYRGGFGSAGHLPDAGGALDQPALMIDAFDAMSSAADTLLAERREQGGHR